jgi:UDP-2,3-diacylglucosamine pyrophosphatase LpxH
MRLAEEIVVVSDLHLALERDRGLFQADEALAEFFNWVYENVRPGLLILNGDTFDFLVKKDQEAAIDLDAASREARTIAENHSEVFQALSLIANSEQHELLIMGGNHDPELSLTGVQQEIEAQLHPSGPRSSLRWSINGEAARFEVGKANVLIEHGDQYDAWNWIDHESLRRVVCLASRNVDYPNAYKSPPGSQLVVNRFNPLRNQFPWLATLQPLTPTILPLALEVILPELPSDQRRTLLKAVNEFSRYSLRSLPDLALRKLKPESEYWAEDDDERQLLIEWLDQYEKNEDTWGVVGETVERFRRALTRLRNILSTAGLRRISAKDSFYKVDVPDSLNGAVTRLTDQGAHLVVFGHTHSAKAYLVGQGLYLNSGTWAQLTRLPKEDTSETVWADFLQELKEGRAGSFCCPTFIRISKGQATTATLFEWQNGRPEAKSAWRFATHGWQKEG